MKGKGAAAQYGAQCLDKFTAAEGEAVSEFFAELKQHIALPKREREALLRDFENALLYYVSAGVPLEEALSRLSAANLGGFYVRPPRLWFALDNAAKIYPLSMHHGYMAVFRLSVYLKENVIPEILQIALTFTIKRFQSFATTVKKGFFWHYLDATKRRYSSEPERDLPCRPLKVSRSGSQSFRVLYYGNRISVEYFHILTDGTGGMTFLKTLTAEYLRLLGIKAQPGYGVLPVNGVPTATEMANEFSRADKRESASGFVDKQAVQFSGKLAPQKPCRIIHFKMDALRLRDVAKGKAATVTAYMLALMFVAGKRATDGCQGDFNIQVPVNMRKYYPSDTLRNFAMYCGIRLPIAEISDVDSILPEILSQLHKKSSKAAMNEMMNSTERMISMVRYIPLFIKAPVGRLIYGFLGDRLFSSVLSNLGPVTIPPELGEHIESMDFVLGTALLNRVSCSLVTFGNTATLSIAKATADPSFEEALYELLTGDGLTPAVEGSAQYEG